MKDLAPVSIITYTRIDHLIKVIEALRDNYLSNETIVYIFSDAPRQGDEKKVATLRSYLKTINYFKKLVVVEQEKNDIDKNFKDFFQVPLAKHGKVILMEDDIVVSKNFLNYMNTALDEYEDDKRIFAISGYTPNVDYSVLKEDVYLSKDFSAWGFGIWANRNIGSVLAKLDYYSSIKKNPTVRKLVNSLHPYTMEVLEAVEEKRDNPGDHKMSAHLYLNGLFTVKPKKSLTKNIGFDGSGLHCGVSNHFDTILEDDFLPKITKNIQYDIKNDKKLFNYYFPRTKTKKIKILFKNFLKYNMSDNNYKRLKNWIKKYT